MDYLRTTVNVNLSVKTANCENNNLVCCSGILSTARRFKSEAAAPTEESRRELPLNGTIFSAFFNQVKVNTDRSIISSNCS